MAADNIPLRESIPLEKSKVIKKTITSIGGTVLILLFFAILLLMPVLSTALNFLWYIIIGALALIVIVIIAAYIYQLQYFKTYFYDSKNGFLIIKKGVILPKETTLPFEKLNDVYVDQDLFDRIFGLYDVHFSTATEASGLAAHVDGLKKDNADKLRDLILSEIKDSVKSSRK